SATLRRFRIDAAPIVAYGHQRAGLGCRAWLATPVLGRSLFQRLRDDDFAGATRESVCRAAARLTVGLAEMEFFNRDHKPSNIIVDDTGRPWLIDTGSVRQGPHPDLDAMLRLLDEIIAIGKAREQDRTWFLDEAARLRKERHL